MSHCGNEVQKETVASCSTRDLKVPSMIPQPATYVLSCKPRGRNVDVVLIPTVPLLLSPPLFSLTFPTADVNGNI